MSTFEQMQQDNDRVMDQVLLCLDTGHISKARKILASFEARHPDMLCRARFEALKARANAAPLAITTGAMEVTA